MDDQPDIPGRTCINCGNTITPEAKFCNHCGFTQAVGQTHRNWQKTLTGLLCFFGLLVVVCLVGNFSGETGIDFLLLIDLLFIVITLTGAAFIWQEIRSFLQWRKFNLLKLIGYILLSVSLAIVVNIIIDWLNKSMFDVEIYYYQAFEHLKYAKLITILMIAVQPALFEELAFRGVIQSGLSRIIEPQQAIYLTAFLFAIIHMSLLSLFWLIPFAILLSYVRNKEHTLWYGVVMHFFFNTTACFLEFFKLDVL